jgi:hypothetical protein
MGPTLRLRTALVVAALVALGCSNRVDAPFETSTAPTLEAAKAATDAIGLVDLSAGRVTRVEGEFRFRFEPDGGPATEWESFATTYQSTMQGDDVTPVPGGPSYRPEEYLEVSDSSTVLNTYLWRQDKSGLYLYQEDVAAPASLSAHRSAAIARALASIEQKRTALRGALTEMPLLRAGQAGGPGPHEITFLEYPLHPNATWEGRPGFNVWTVEAKEWLDTPAGRFHAARIDIVLPQFFGPGDYALTWWAEPGEIQRHYHLFGDMTDESGNIIGKVETDETFQVTQYTHPL